MKVVQYNIINYIKQKIAKIANRYKIACKMEEKTKLKINKKDNG